MELERLRQLIRQREHFYRSAESLDLVQMVRYLVQLGEHVKDEHDCDAHGWENREYAVRTAKAWLAEIDGPDRPNLQPSRRDIPPVMSSDTLRALKAAASKGRWDVYGDMLEVGGEPVWMPADLELLAYLANRADFIADLLDARDGLRRDRLQALRIADALTLDTQSLAEAVTELVRLVHQARKERDDALVELQRQTGPLDSSCRTCNGLGYARAANGDTGSCDCLERKTT